VLTNLNIPEWQECLQDYHDHIVCDYLQYGWPVNYDYASFNFPVSDDRTHKGALEFPDVVTRYLDSEIACGAVAGPFDTVPFLSGKMALSPLNSVPKSDRMERRIILDLSWPFSTSVTDGISLTEYDAFLSIWSILLLTLLLLVLLTLVVVVIFINVTCIGHITSFWLILVIILC